MQEEGVVSFTTPSSNLVSPVTRREDPFDWHTTNSMIKVRPYGSTKFSLGNTSLHKQPMLNQHDVNGPYRKHWRDYIFYSWMRIHCAEKTYSNGRVANCCRFVVALAAPLLISLFFFKWGRSKDALQNFHELITYWPITYSNLANPVKIRKNVD